MKQLVHAIVITVFLLLLHPREVKATHAAGAELLYEWVSDSTYRFYYKFYRDCLGGVGVAPDSVTMCAYNSCTFLYVNMFTLNKVRTLPNGLPNGSEVGTSCPAFPTTCQLLSSAIPGYEEWWYTGLVTLPSRCDSWTFAYATTARNLSITSLQMPANQALYVEATLNNLDVQDNTSPFFSIKPVPFTCNNISYTYNIGAFDKNNDSMRFEMIRPLGYTGNLNNGVVNCGPGYITTIPFSSPVYNITNNPLSTGNTFALNPANGQMSFTPNMLQRAPIAMRVTEYRNQKKIGSVMRDMQITVLNCMQPQPKVSINTNTMVGANYIDSTIVVNACRKADFCFRIKSPDTSAILVASDNHITIFPSAAISYTNQGTDSITGCISWMSNDTDIGTKVLSITVIDSTCRFPGVIVAQTFSILIRVLPRTNEFSSVAMCPGDSVQLIPRASNDFAWSVLTGAPISTLSCINCVNPVARPLISTTYLATYTSPGTCKIVDTISVSVDVTDVAITPSGPITLCKADTIHLEAQATGSIPLTNLPCGLSTTIPTTIPDSVILAVPNVPVQGGGNPVSTPFSGNQITSRHQYLIRAKDMIKARMHSGTLRSISFRISGNAMPATFDNLKLSLGCTVLNELSLANGFINGLQAVYTASGSVMTPAGGGYIIFNFNNNYNWDTTQNLVVEICYANNTITPVAYTFFSTMPYNASLSDFAPTGNICSSTSGSNMAVSNELPIMRLGYYPAPVGNFTYTWSSSADYPIAAIQRPGIFIDKDQEIYVRTKNRNNCEVGDTISVTVHQVTLIRRDTVICYREILKIQAPAGYANYEWTTNPGDHLETLSCAQCMETYITPTDTMEYIALMENSAQCKDSFVFTVNVKPLPLLIIFPQDTIIKYADSVRLLVTGAHSYTWSPSSTLDDPNMYDPLATPKETTLYTVVGRSDLGCENKDSVLVSIDYSNPLFIPSAFTPNGDGRNDIFRMSNMKFEKILFFRIFNRWGQQLFEANDNSGWDGTWNGTPQDINTYQYLIRVATVDGREETYKGNVTLLR